MRRILSSGSESQNLLNKHFQALYFEIKCSDRFIPTISVDRCRASYESELKREVGCRSRGLSSPPDDERRSRGRSNPQTGWHFADCGATAAHTVLQITLKTYVTRHFLFHKSPFGPLRLWIGSLVINNRTAVVISHSAREVCAAPFTSKKPPRNF